MERREIRLGDAPAPSARAARGSVTARDLDLRSSRVKFHLSSPVDISRWHLDLPTQYPHHQVSHLLRRPQGGVDLTDPVAPLHRLHQDHVQSLSLQVLSHLFFGVTPSGE